MPANTGTSETLADYRTFTGNISLQKSGIILANQLKLRSETLGDTISNGAYYYLSDECMIGWHRDWKQFFKKQTEHDGQDYK